jgi:hypothetical protein
MQDRPERVTETVFSERVARVVERSVPSGETGAEKVVIPGSRETIEEETTRISPEKRPADPKVGPKGLRLQVLFLWLAFLALAITLGLMVNIYVGVVTIALGTIGLLFNPVVGATEKRAEEREIIAEHHREPEPGEVVVRTTSRRKERRFNRMM